MKRASAKGTRDSQLLWSHRGHALHVAQAVAEYDVVTRDAELENCRVAEQELFVMVVPSDVSPELLCHARATWTQEISI